MSNRKSIEDLPPHTGVWELFRKLADPRTTAEELKELAKLSDEEFAETKPRQHIVAN